MRFVGSCNTKTCPFRLEIVLDDSPGSDDEIGPTGITVQLAAANHEMYHEGHKVALVRRYPRLLTPPPAVI
jgi:hypothetical protein